MEGRFSLGLLFSVFLVKHLFELNVKFVINEHYKKRGISWAFGIFQPQRTISQKYSFYQNLHAQIRLVALEFWADVANVFSLFKIIP
jgi:hypothetical protein